MPCTTGTFARQIQTPPDPEFELTAPRLENAVHAAGAWTTRQSAAVSAQAMSDGTANQSEMRCGGKHVPIICPDFHEPGICSRDQMEYVERS